MEIRPGVEVVEAAHDDVDCLERFYRGRPGHALFDRPAPAAQPDPPHHTAHDHGLLPAEPEVQPRHADEAGAIRPRYAIRVDPNDFTDAEMSELLDDVAATATQADDRHPCVAERALAVVSHNCELSGEILSRGATRAIEQ